MSKPTQRDDREKEGKLNDYRLGLGLTVKEVCDATGVSPNTYMRLNSGMDSPLHERTTRKHWAGKVKPKAQALADFFGVEPAEIWPRYICGMKRVGVSDEEVAEALHGNLLVREHPLQTIAKKRLWANICKVLSPRQMRLLRLLLAGYGHTEIANRMGLSINRPLQLERNLIRRVKGYIRHRGFRELYEEGYTDDQTW